MDKSNFIKTQDDYEPIEFNEQGDLAYKLSDNQTCSWAKPDELFNLKKLRDRIEPWLTSLVQSEHLSLLVGSGLSYAIKDIALPQSEEVETVKGQEKHMSSSSWPVFNDVLVKAAVDSAKAVNRTVPNFEDDIRVANELYRGLEILICSEAETERIAKSDVETLSRAIENKLLTFAQGILKDETSIATAKEENRGRAFSILVSFLMSFASRTGTHDRLNIFTTNYDRIIETGAEMAGIHLLDRFVGSLMPILRSSRMDLDLHYNPPGIRGEPRYLEGVARFTKLHGSIDWVQVGREIRRIGLPFGAVDLNQFLSAPGYLSATLQELMIYPNAAKDRETALFPYVELFRDLAASICRPNSTLFTYGYSFGDEHINRIIEDMLTIPSTHLVIISQDDSLGRIKEMYKRLKRSTQITMLLGPVLADLGTLTSRFLPKASIDKATFRMNELLSKRMGPTESVHKNPTDLGGDA